LTQTKTEVAKCDPKLKHKKDMAFNTIPQEQIIYKILVLRKEKVMLDLHLAELYGVETRALKQAVRRNLSLFPEDFMFELSLQEVEDVVSQNVIPSKQHLGGALPFAFTETGVAMLSSVLKSARAREMNIAIMRAFIALRKILVDNGELHLELEKIRKQVDNHDKNIELVFKYLDELMAKLEKPVPVRKQIGYKAGDDQ